MTRIQIKKTTLLMWRRTVLGVTSQILIVGLYQNHETIIKNSSIIQNFKRFIKSLIHQDLMEYIKKIIPILICGISIGLYLK